MTKIYTAGEHARVIKSDLVYEEALGDQKGLVGTVTSGNRSGGALLKFPHVEKPYYYRYNEIEPVGNRTTSAEAVDTASRFSEGDHVRFLPGHNDAWTGAEFIVVDGDPTPFGNVRVEFTKLSEGTRRVYSLGSEVRIGRHKLEKFTPPFEPKFKAGDWVQVRSGWGEWSGKPAQVLEVPINPYHHYKIKTVKPVGVGNHEGLFFEANLEQSEEPHWTETKPVGALGQVKRDDQPERVLLKISETEWLHLYQDERNGEVAAAAQRSIRSTKSLLDTPQIEIMWKLDVKL